jgi:hypothetical protein
MYLEISLPGVSKFHNQELHVYAMITHVFFLFCFHGICSNLSLLLLTSKPTTLLGCPYHNIVIISMALVVRIEMNGSQALFSHDDVVEDLKGQGWDIFIKKFKGYNLHVSKEFTQTFDGYIAKVGDIQLEMTEEFLSEATRLPLSGHKWFKNSKIDEVPWSLFMTSKKIDCCEKGVHVSLLKVRWHGPLSILKQFITCEGHMAWFFFTMCNFLCTL